MSGMVTEIKMERFSASLQARQSKRSRLLSKGFLHLDSASCEVHFLAKAILDCEKRHRRNRDLVGYRWRLLMSKARRNRAIDTPQGPPKQGGTASPGKPSKKGGILAA